MGGGEVARYIDTYGTDRIAKAVLASAVPPFLHKADDNPDGALDDDAIAGFLAGVDSDRIAFLDEFTTGFLHRRRRAENQRSATRLRPRHRRVRLP